MRNERRAAVTGSSAGIGRAVAAALLEQGWRVVGLDRAAATLDHPRFEGRPVDLADANAIAGALPGVLDCDALVHAAGIMRTAPLGSLDGADFESMWRLHVAAGSQLADGMVPAMAARGRGRVVLIGSRVSRGMAGRSQYAAVKAALVAMGRSWAAEVAARGVTVNVVSPAATRTAMLDDPGRAASAPRLPPRGRLIEPAEVAALVGFLLSDAAAAITGQDIQVCGGASLSG
ncbi:SDR family NAD(P)-dependent oxidoreductase [Pigmentiphaga kullae]|uniref:NADP-dependent 3-hydroxy acid dehydrogenase YdfG n=1 Tax=Pigmentiphaga kullae TaxID=151784 RepID=A0A4Q7NEP2_9BURK|nr:SDR family oxidoreductase [Pigmentiphaga kullae]RZS81473.1 NADP-dependent 3-hydroxy acid dehydrogenase YdfG [Pigmentiphaga kullae]